MSTLQDVTTEAPVIEAVPKKAMTLGYGASGLVTTSPWTPPVHFSK